DLREALKHQIVDLSTRFRVLSDFTALLVLETEADYARFHIDRRALSDILTVGPTGIEVLDRRRQPVEIARPTVVNLPPAARVMTLPSTPMVTPRPAPPPASPMPEPAQASGTASTGAGADIQQEMRRSQDRARVQQERQRSEQRDARIVMRPPPPRPMDSPD